MAAVITGWQMFLLHYRQMCPELMLEMSHWVTSGKRKGDSTEAECKLLKWEPKSAADDVEVAKEVRG